jgi:flagellar protein FliO/FliZ
MLQLVKAVFDIIVLLALFVGVLYLAHFLTKRIGKASELMVNNRNMKLIEVMCLSQGQYLYIVRIGEKYHLFSGSKENIRYCMELDKEMITMPDKNEKSFIHYLNIMNDKQEKKNEE